MSGGAPTKRDKKLNYELELFEQNLEDLLASETGQTTTVTVGSGPRGVGASGGVHAGAADPDDDCSEADELDASGDFGCEDLMLDDLSEWNVILAEPCNLQPTTPLTNTQLSNTTNTSPSTLATTRKQKRFKTGGGSGSSSASTTTLSTSPASLSDTENNTAQALKATGSRSAPTTRDG